MTQRYVLKPRIFGFICTTSHPEGCRREVLRQVELAREGVPESPEGGNMLVVGSSMGYGLAARITGAFHHGMNTLGVAYERPARLKRSATAGWYNTATFHQAAREQGLFADTVIGDAFSNEILEETLEHAARHLGPLDYFVYSLAAPRRTDPETGVEYRSTIKAVGRAARTRMLDTTTGEVGEAVFEEATEEEIAGTVAVMGGADLERWTRALLDRGLFKPGARALAFSYIGPEVTHAIYRDGTIGQAKQHLETTVGGLNDLLAREAGASCHTVVAKSVVTQSSSAIPAIALYISLVFKVMKEKGLHEEAIDQMLRLFRDHVVPDSEPRTDEAGRIRIDDQELREDIQREVRRRWELVGTDSVNEHCDLEGYRADFLRLFGFGVEGVDYSRPVDLDIRL